MVRIISALTAILVSGAVFGQNGAPARDGSEASAIGTSGQMQTKGNVLEIRPDAPDRYVVVKGDTLWHIAGRYLTTPWRWPELWRMNKDQIRNPHLIYPGDALLLDRASGTLSLERRDTDRLQPKVYEESLRKAIPSIPVNVIEPFLSQPLVVTPGQLDGAPRIVGVQEGRVMLGAGDEAYATGVRTDNRLWQIYRPGKAMVDPDNGEVLGNEAIYLGDATLERAGEPALLKITSAKQEIGRGDRLVQTEISLLTNYMPRRPEGNPVAKVMSIYGMSSLAGQYSIVTINKGKRDGMETGHVLALHRAGKAVELRSETHVKETVQLPEDRYGLVFLFRVYDRVSYALVMNSSLPVQIGDVGRAP